MAFFRRVLDHLLNQVLVEGLANSRVFQRFAVWSNGAIKEMSEQGRYTEADGRLAHKSGPGTLRDPSGMDPHLRLLDAAALSTASSRISAWLLLTADEPWMQQQQAMRSSWPA